MPAKMLFSKCCYVAAILVVVGVLESASVFASEPPVSFNRDVRPILSNICFQCHGPDVNARKADLRLDLEEAAVGGKTPPIVRGKPDESPLYQRIMAADESEVMPPPESKKTLTAAQKDILKRWIEQGAKYQKHWAFEPVQRPDLASFPDGTQPIDKFLLAGLKQVGLAPQPEASRETLIRRVAFALTGLPPTIKEVDEFLADSSPQAYEHMVDRYLQSIHFGEEMARHWLDVARYADTHGLHLDNERQMWAYRDWVVKAFNDNLPFDKFTVWQIAGDLLPNPNTDQLIATGFNRCNVTTSEGGSIDVEFVYRYAVERTTAVSQAWLGLTAGCAVCHDHKYDPLTTKEFYSLYAFFNSAADPAMDGNINVTAPFMKLPRPEQKETAEAAGKVEREARSWLDTVVSHTTYSDPADASTKDARKAIREILFDDAFPIGVTTKSSSRNAIDWVVDPAYKAASGRRVIRQRSASSYTDTLDFKLRPLHIPHDGIVEVWLRADPQDVPKSVSVGVPTKQTITWTKTDQGLVREGKGDAPIQPGTWTKLTVPAAELGLNPGDRLTSITLNETGGIAYWDSLAVVGQTDPATDPLESLKAWRKAQGTTVPPELPAELHSLVQGGPDKPLTAEEGANLTRYYLAVVARPVNEELQAARSAWHAARVARLIAEESAPGTFVYRELEKPRESFIMVRGQYDKPGEKVEPAVPAVFPPIKKSAPDSRLTRLDLANWLVAPENPLTARVTVNRFWQQIFGTGLVKTSFDFGSQGEPPSHPELLDWLASEFREMGWDVKRFVKMLVMSDAFRRQSQMTAEMLATDPGNRLYAHGPRFRLDAEQVRDNVLFTSGLINLEFGGRGVNTYQPPNIWEPVGYSDSNTRFYLQDHGPALYRRTLYAFLKRTAPPPFMSNFDAPNREQVCTLRERSNTPLQALQLLNDIQHFEAARALAERALAEGGNTNEDRITYLYRTVLARRPSTEETQLIAAAFSKQIELFQPDVEAAKQAIQVGESAPKGTATPVETAAWTMVANLILNLDETLNR
jgi:hypothetical protein